MCPVSSLSLRLERQRVLREGSPAHAVLNVQHVRHAGLRLRGKLALQTAQRVRCRVYPSRGLCYTERVDYPLTKISQNFASCSCRAIGVQEVDFISSIFREKHLEKHRSPLSHFGCVEKDQRPNKGATSECFVDDKIKHVQVPRSAHF